MRKEVVYSIWIVSILLGIFILIKFGPSITTASVALEKTDCVSPGEALQYINEQGCKRIYKDPECEASGKVEIRCPAGEEEASEEKACNDAAKATKNVCDSECNEEEKACNDAAKAAKEACEEEEKACKDAAKAAKEACTSACNEEDAVCEETCKQDERAAKEACEKPCKDDEKAAKASCDEGHKACKKTCKDNEKAAKDACKD